MDFALHAYGQDAWCSMLPESADERVPDVSMPDVVQDVMRKCG